MAKGGDTSKPFTTNATGVATGLNADRVDGKHAEDIAKDAVAASQALRPFAQVTGNGTVEQSRGVQANGVSDAPAGAGSSTIVFTGDLSACALNATLIGTGPGQISVTPTVAANKTTTSVEVRTFNATGMPDNRAFHVSANC